MKSRGRHSRKGNARTGNTHAVNKRLASLGAAAILAATGIATVGASTASAAPASPAYWTAGTVTPSVNGLRIRSGPSTNYVAYGLLYRGDRMWVIQEVRHGSAGYWCHVRLTRRSASGLRSGFTGWVYAPYLRRA